MTPEWRERARAVGFDMKRPKISPNTNLAHEATTYAKEKGLDNEFHHALASAYWERGADFGQVSVLKQAAEEAGLDWSELSGRLDSGHYRDRVLQLDQDAKDRGVGGTPTYMIGGEVIFGDLSIDDLVAAVGKASS